MPAGRPEALEAPFSSSQGSCCAASRQLLAQISNRRENILAGAMKAGERRKGPSESKSFTFLQRLGISVVTVVGWALVWAIGSTLRYKIEDWERFQALKDKDLAIIYSFWHNQIFSATHFWRCRGITVITSQHFDGEYIARIIEKFGYYAARGSSRRGGAGALFELKRCLKEGHDVAFTVDGPKGPPYRVKPGPLWLSQKTGAPIVPFYVQPRKFWRLKSWDEFRIPKPFSKVLVKIGRPLTVERGELGLWVTRYQDEMDRIGKCCDSRWPQG